MALPRGPRHPQGAALSSTRRFSLALPIALTFMLASRVAAGLPEEPTTLPPSLVVAKGALEVVRRPDSVSYKVRTPYPASDVLAEIRKQLESSGWSPLPRESTTSFYRSSLEVGWRSHVVDRMPDKGTRGESFVWIAEWSNPAGEVVAYTLRYASGPPEPGREGSKPDNDELRVNAFLKKNRMLRVEDLPASLIVLDGARDVMAQREPAADQIVFGGDGTISESRDPNKASQKTRVVYMLPAPRPPTAAMATLDERLKGQGWVEAAEEPPPWINAKKWAETHKPGWSAETSKLPTGLLESKWRAHWKNPAGDTVLYALTSRQTAPADEAGAAQPAAVDYLVDASLRLWTGKRAAGAAAEPPAVTKTPRSSAQIEAGVEPAYRRGDHDTLLELLRESESGDRALLDRYRLAAEGGSSLAQGILGVMYESGIGQPEDAARAVEWFRKAADQGDATGQKYLGDMYRQGNGTTTDYSEAMKWYLRASDQGDGPAQAMLGYMYQNGLGVLPNDTRVYMWFTVSASSLEGSYRKSMLEARSRLAAGMSAASIEEAERQVRDGKPTASTWRAEPGDLAWRVVDLDDSLWIVDTMFGKRPMGTLSLAGEEVTEANAKEVRARLGRQKAELEGELKSIEVRDVRGKYELRPGERDECKISKSARSATLLKPLQIVQNNHEIEFQGEGLKGCGVAAGDVIVLKMPCGGTSPYRLIGRVTASGIETTTWDKSSDNHCLLGILMKSAGAR